MGYISEFLRSFSKDPETHVTGRVVVVAHFAIAASMVPLASLSVYYWAPFNLVAMGILEIFIGLSLWLMWKLKAPSVGANFLNILGLISMTYFYTINGASSSGILVFLFVNLALNTLALGSRASVVWFLFALALTNIRNVSDLGLGTDN